MPAPLPAEEPAMTESHSSVQDHSRSAAMRCNLIVDLCMVSEHYPITMSKRSHCVYCKLTGSVDHYSSRQCAECKVALCTIDRDCVTKWHDPNFTRRRKRWNQSSNEVTQSSNEVTQSTNEATRLEITLAKRGRPQGSVKTKGRGRRRKQKW